MPSISRINDYFDWFKKKISLDQNARYSASRSVRRGEVYYCYLGRGIGSEEEKLRPCVIIQNDNGNIHSPNTIIAPITNTAGVPKVTVSITGAYSYNDGGITKTLTGHILLANIQTVSKARLGNQCLAKLTREMGEVDEKLMVSTGVYRLYNDLIKKQSASKRTIKRMSTEINSLRKSLADTEKHLLEARKELAEK